MIVQLVPGPAFDRSTRKIAPHIVLNAPDDSVLMQPEIFGPILPLRGYTSLDAVIKSVNARPRPLAIYPFSNDRGQKTGGRLVKHARYYWLLLAENHLTRRLFGAMVRRIEALPMPAG
jgi:acyl-CoA reductase-like NAD-dependent aldehyde dehydrogenase